MYLGEWCITIGKLACASIYLIGLEIKKVFESF